jgi:hypothetical protein
MKMKKMTGQYTGNVDDNNKDLIVTGIIPFKELNPAFNTAQSGHSEF